tara:strand:+ start:81 stop:446 length:366 start_codon:yes stop_codon:yes gene_type:complete
MADDKQTLTKEQRADRKQEFDQLIKNFQGSDEERSIEIEKLFKKYKKDLDGQISEKEIEILKEKFGKLNLRRAKEKEKKPKKNPIGADLMYASKGGMASKKSKVAGRLALRGYGRAMKGKK